MGTVLQIRDLAVRFDLPEGPLRAVDGVSFRVPAGRTVALVGETGSGKSVIAQAILGILPAKARIERGEILFRDPDTPGSKIDVSRLAPESREMRDLRGRRISMIFQEPMTSLSPLHTIGDQIGEALTLHRPVRGAEADETVREMLRLCGFPDPKRAMHSYPFELSGGLRQRAMIAMALICRPALLIADEPTTALDVTIQAQILKLIKELQATFGMAMLIITHDLGVVANVADEVAVIYHGQLTESGPVADIFRQPEHPYLQALLRAVPRFDLPAGQRLVPIREIPRVESKMPREREPWPAGADAAPLLAVHNVSKSYRIRKRSWLPARMGGEEDGEVVAVEDVSFFIRRGECLGLVGESGCGKTTVSKAVMRAIRVNDGKILFNDRGRVVNVLDIKGDALLAYRRKVQFIFQDPFSSLNPRMTVFDIVSEPLVIHGIGDREERFARTRELLTLVGLDPRFMRRYPHSFSGGQRQRIGIARALALQPELLICDEPVSALDVSVQAQVLNLLKDLQKEFDLTYLFISHNLAVVDYIADQIAVMCAGRLVEIAPREVLFREPRHPYTKALLSAVPTPDLDHRLNLSQVLEGKTSDPTAWPEPFTIDARHRPSLVHLGAGHYLRATVPEAVTETV